MSNDMPQVISFSGGRTSAYLCARLLEVFPRERLHFVFMDTGAEHAKTYEFIRNVDAHFGLRLTCLRADSSLPLGVGVRPVVVPINDIGSDLKPFQAFCGKYGTPTAKTPGCTSRMKERIYMKWGNAAFGRRQWVSWIGIRADEPKRLRRMGENPLWRFLAEIDDADKADVLEFWRGMPFDLEIPEHLGNCVFCVKKSTAKLALAARDEPKMAEAWEAMIDAAPHRAKPPGFLPTEIYRSKRTFRQVLAEYADVPTEVLRSRIRSLRNDANTCSESCEVFVSSPQLSMPWGDSA